MNAQEAPTARAIQPSPHRLADPAATPPANSSTNTIAAWISPHSRPISTRRPAGITTAVADSLVSTTPQIYDRERQLSSNTDGPARRII